MRIAIPKMCHAVELVSVRVGLQVQERHTYVFRRQEDLLPIHRSVFGLLWKTLVVHSFLHPRHLDVVPLLLEPHPVAVRSRPALCRYSIASSKSVQLFC